jgi:hypothetical protein
MQIKKIICLKKIQIKMFKMFCQKNLIQQKSTNITFSNIFFLKPSFMLDFNQVHTYACM